MIGKLIHNTDIGGGGEKPTPQSGNQTADSAEKPRP
jgi:hypothetical protein